ncbi:hypothetical protein [Chroococcidiopsis sp. CCMEE 29]|uniref:hypothetical protein n=1 Tax=Chroococcidiopsis sp. CCMEE 29 TaxID=155894 RepID=UPI0020201F1F|nr:hypothetical protein [Chroococcidiopsis sp. CCMEE 29]
MIASVKTLLSSVVDYAGLFPPAKLSMREAMAKYAQDKTSNYSWMLGRFVLPESRLNEFEELLPQFPLKQWSLSIILSKELTSEIERVRSLNNSKIAIAALEFPPLSPTQIERVFPLLPAGVDLFFEISLHGNLEFHLDVLRRTGASAKVRTGGITTDAFPRMNQLCQYIFSFAEAQVPFKATAGLHHLLPGNHRLTSEPNSPSALMQGFLNVAILAALVYWQKLTPEDALAVLKESSIEGFQFKADSIGWRDRQLSIAEIEEARQQFFRSFGSCSFQEPIDDLKELKLL